MSLLSDWYDRVNAGEYAGYSSFLAKCFESSAIKPSILLDVGCGTGGITSLMADMGYDMIGLDISSDMLSIAKKHPKVLYIYGDMRDFELYGTVQGAYSSYDCFNCMLTTDDLQAAFNRVALFTEARSLFVFDLNTDYRAREIYDGRSYTFEDGDDMLIWRSCYRQNKRVDFYLTGFDYKKGAYVRRDDVIQERIYSTKTVQKLLTQAGFKLIDIYGGTDFEPFTSDSQKAYYIAERI